MSYREPATRESEPRKPTDWEHVGEFMACLGASLVVAFTFCAFLWHTTEYAASGRIHHTPDWTTWGQCISAFLGALGLPPMWLGKKRP